MAPQEGRFRVGYALACGNTWEHGRYGSLRQALIAEEDLRRYLARFYHTFATFTFDGEDPERGYLTDDDLVEYGEEYADPSEVEE